MTYEIISDHAFKRRKHWVSEIVKISGNFGQDYTRVEAELSAEVEEGGLSAVLDHLHLCGVIPEVYGHDTSEEKLYSKYTDALLAVTFRSLGLKSIVLTERADAADVEVFAQDYSFVADAKAFRLTRTAKNQKDFKVQAMDGWRRDKKYAVLVAPLYQFPSANSQIYQQAISRDVCLLSYSHLAVLVTIAMRLSQRKAQDLLTNVLSVVANMNPGKSASDYWREINKTYLATYPETELFWRIEKKANLESILAAKEEGLRYLAEQREIIMKLSHEEALRQLIIKNKLDSKISVLNRVSDNGLLSIVAG